ncbi:Disease resistance protein [Quillaja saponaria]|uniref:Disease resistance protein n=1 Tax=Quillaja saponaria TaxID=32244 RepID=A0AAD7L5P5_QUISA|nr:Disease resistance protein [Quillaja saponaria]
MDLGAIVEIITRLWDCSSNRVDYIRNLENNLNTLQNARNELKSIGQDVRREIELAEEQQLEPTNEVKNWLVNVEAKEKEIDLILQKGAQVTDPNNSCWKYSKNFYKSYKIGKSLPEKVQKVEELIDKRRSFHVAAQNLKHVPAEELPLETTTVGLESTFDKVCISFQDTRVGTIGLYGMGGVGKTTLLKKFNNDFLATRNQNFDLVIWVVVSQVVDIAGAQEVIRNKLHIRDEIWLNKNMDERAVLIFNLLKKKKFVLLLDDIWKRFELLKLGVPIPDTHNACKVIFTTRSEEVCGHMEAHRRIRVECLAPQKAFELFKEKVGEETLNSHPDIPDLAKKVAAECQGLPLALITVGRTMAKKEEPKEWERVIEILKSYPAKFSEDHNINIDELLELWFGEGFFDELGDVYEARKEGEDIIKYLKLACLLDRGETEDCVRMHDVIRDMALWVACKQGSESKFVVKNASMVADSDLAKWKNTERLSIWRSRFETYYWRPEYTPKPSSVLVRDTKLHRFPHGFFSYVQPIKVLDLSHNDNLNNLPAEICQLVHLQYLNLSYTSIRTVPVELKNLTSLRCLLVNFSYILSFPSNVLSSLSSLEVFGKLMIRDEVGLHPYYDENSFLQELECLEHLKDISIMLFKVESVHTLSNFIRVQKCIKYLWLHIPNDFKFTGHRYFSRLQTLRVTYCGIPDLNWLLHAPNLQSLELIGCDLLEEVIGEDFGAAEEEEVNWDAFESLKTLELRNLPRLRSVSPQALRFPCLKNVKVKYCPSLTKLPFDSSTAKNTLEFIKGDSDWWSCLQWEDESTKDIFSSKFQIIGDYD